MASTIFEHLGPWCFDELADLPDDGRRYEVVDGALVVTPPPSQHHQLVGSRLREQLAEACPATWEVVQEYPLPLGTDGRVPDLAVVRRRRLDAGPSPYPQGPADFGLVVEVTSPSTRKTDLFAKPGEYAEAGIPLFWRVDAEPALSLCVFVLSACGYELRGVITGAGGPATTPWGDVAVDLDRVRTGRR